LKGPRFEDAALFTDKALTSQRLRSSGVPVPDLYWSGDAPATPDDHVLAALDGRDIVIKPRDGNNSRGVTILRNAPREAIRSALAAPAAGSRRMMIERFLEGRIGNVDGLVVDGVLLPISTTIRLDDPDRPAVCRAMIQPAGLPGHDARMFALAQRVADAVGYHAGPLTMDVVIAGDGTVHVLEVSPHFHNISCEIARGNGNPMAAYGAWLLGRPDWRQHLPSGSARHGVCYQKFVDASGVVEEIAGVEALRALPGFVDATFFCGPGDRVRCAAGERDRLCLVWASAETREALDRIIEHIEHDVRAVVCADVVHSR
jgi:hypothetical protein